MIPIAQYFPASWSFSLASQQLHSQLAPFSLGLATSPRSQQAQTKKMKTPILFAAWTAFVIMAVPSESQGRAANSAASVKPNPSASPGTSFTASVRAAVLDSLNESRKTQKEHEGDSLSLKDYDALTKRKSLQNRALKATEVAIQQAQQTAIGSGADAINKLLEAERFARAQLAQVVETSAPGWRKVALDSVDQAIAKTTQALGQ
jgi:hypothetical protein